MQINHKKIANHNCRRPVRPIYGLYPIKPELSAIPLKNLDIQVDILNSIARVEYAQTYVNNSSGLLECEFMFPIQPSACFDSFRAEFEDTVIEGIVKKKDEAKEEYKESVDAGKTVAYAEIIEDVSDVMKVKIGNIPPNKDIKIVFSYIEKLEVAMNKFWCYKLYSTLTPRYNPASNQGDKDLYLLSSYPTISQKDSRAFPWNIIVNIQSPTPITTVKSPTHQILRELSNENHCCKLFLNPVQNEVPNKDFIVYFENGQEKKPSAMITPTESGYCAMVNFVPEFEKVSVDEAYAALQMQNAKEVFGDADMSKTRGEYLFVIDRSGSMSGKRIEMAKNALSLFLKSLPINSKYNVVSFGSSFEYLHPESLSYNKENLNKTLSLVNQFSANFGGTEIYSSLNNIFDMKLAKNYPRNVFLLTDGAVGNTNQVLNLIRTRSHKARVFTIGIGSGCSAELITKGAEFGKGKHEFVAENNDIMGKVINLLDSAMSPCVDDFSLTADNFDTIVESISPNPVNVPFLLRDQAVTFFLFLRKGFEKCDLKLKMFDSLKDSYKEFTIELDSNQALENTLIPKLAVHDMIKRLEDTESSIDKSNKDVYFAVKSDIENQLLDLSLQYQILSKKTAFICQVADKSLKTGTLPKQSVIIPTIESTDYSNVSQYGGSMGGAFLQKCKQRGASPMMRASNCAMPQTLSLCNENQKQCVPLSMMDSFSMKKDCNSGASAKSPKSLASFGNTLMDVIQNQEIAGYWNDTDSTTLSKICKNNKLPELPENLKSNKDALNAWITILVLFWMEKAQASQESSWKLISRKANQWLKSIGVNYTDFKADAQKHVTA